MLRNKLLLFLFVIVGLFGFPSIIHASDLSMSCDWHGPCDMSPYSGAPLFYEDNMLPGDTIKRTITVLNKDPENDCRNLSLTVKNPTKTPVGFTNQLYSGMIKDGNPIFGSISLGVANPGFTMQNVFDTQTFSLGTVPANGFSVIDWYATFERLSGNEFQRGMTKFDFDMYFECNSNIQTPIIHIAKFNNSWPNTQIAGSSVVYTLEVWTDESPVDSVIVNDLPPNGFRYRGGTWTASSNKRGDLKAGGITTEPIYASPGKWNLGNMEKEEKVTLTYAADISGDQNPGTYPDLAWAKGTYGGLLIYANAYDDPRYFVGTKVIIDESLQSSASREAIRVLGASTQILPATGANLFVTIVAFGMTIFGFALIFLGKAGKQNEK